jgi:hypothetical protein
MDTRVLLFPRDFLTELEEDGNVLVYAVEAEENLSQKHGEDPEDFMKVVVHFDNEETVNKNIKDFKDNSYDGEHIHAVLKNILSAETLATVKAELMEKEGI